LSNFGNAFKAFFALLGGKLPEEIARAYGFVKAGSAKPAAPVAAKPRNEPKPADGAIQLLAILQRDARLVDLLMEDMSAYTDEQIGTAARNVFEQARKSLEQYVKLVPVVDGVEGEFLKLPGVDPKTYRLLGNVPADGKAPGGTLRHKGWKADKLDLPALKESSWVVAPAEVEV
jgi:hypothetical protein